MGNYDNQGIEVAVVIITIKNRKIHVLLRENASKGNYLLPCVELSNTQDGISGVKAILSDYPLLKYQSIEEVTFLTDPYRNPYKRMVALSYLVVVKAENDNYTWLPLHDLPVLGFDHKQIIDKAIEIMKNRLLHSNIASILLNDEFTLPELQGVYEALLGHKFDRRNFRRKFLSLGLIKATGEMEEAKGHRRGLLYKFLPLQYQEMEIF